MSAPAVAVVVKGYPRLSEGPLILEVVRLISISGRQMALNTNLTELGVLLI
jgi:hypothetical protein